MKWFPFVLMAAAACAPGWAEPKPKLGKAESLFNGRNLEGFSVWLQKRGLNQDPEGVFSVDNGRIHVSGAEFGYLITEREFTDFELTLEFQWGKGTHPPRKENARDSGVLFHVTGENRIWPRSLEFQMIEGGTGDLILVGGTHATVRGQTLDRGRFDRFGKGDWKDVIGYRDPGRELEKSFGQWNKLRLLVHGDHTWFWVNGVLANEATAISERKGRLVFQSEGAEVFFRQIRLRPVLP